MDKYKQFIDINWWSNVNKRSIEGWINNFGSEQELARFILNNILFYNSVQLKSYTRTLTNQLKEIVYVKIRRDNNYSLINDEVLESEWIDYINKTRFMPAALIGDSGSSAFKVIGYWRTELRGANISSIGNLENDYNNGIRRFILVDDFSGSGEQIIKVLEQKIHLSGKEIEVGKIIDYKPDIELVIATYVIHQNAITRINNTFPRIRIMYVNILDDSFNFLNINSFMYEPYSLEKKKHFITKIRTIMESLMEDDTSLKELKKYVLHIPVVFEHGCPNNTLLLLFAHTNNWKQLFRRGEEL